MTWDDLWKTLRDTALILNRGELASLSSSSLEQRTRQLAHQNAPSEEARPLLQVLTFSIGTERYGWPVSRVQAIARIGRITPVPSAPPYYRGVISLRGKILSVMDLNAYLGLPAAEKLPELMIVIDGAGLEIGTVADEVFDVIDIPAAVLSPASNVGLDSDMVLGITPNGLTCLDAEGLLRRERHRLETQTD